MLFILLLAFSAIAIAGSAAFFSVYGLAATFSGTFWSVVVMGSSLEAGKLVAASYLYRYWNLTSKWLRTYLFMGILSLMLLTSTGIYGYLSSGYQTDVLPLKQVTEQVVLLEQEKVRKLERKKQIDDQIARLPDTSIRGRERLIRQFKEEQVQLTARANELDQELLDLKQQQLKTEAHIGPITYIAKAFGMGTDDATKYLILLIIFAFDPMAVALTLAVNIAIRDRENTKKQAQQEEMIVLPVTEPVVTESSSSTLNEETIAEHQGIETQTDANVVASLEPEVREPQNVDVPPAILNVSETQDAVVIPAEKGKVDPVGYTGPNRFLSWDLDRAQAKIKELVGYYNHLNEKLSSSTLTDQESQEKKSIENILTRLGYNSYL